MPRYKIQSYKRRTWEPGVIVHAEITVLNYNIKNPCGREPNEHTSPICVVYTSFVSAKGYVKVTLSKIAKLLIQMITKVILESSIIQTTKLKRYSDLSDLSCEYKIILKYN
ncbi:hypothetical protein MXB_5183 [Myxobolus squamalis]|nr:hypothetical protein MXB_5183 [Myxobolus squamalis]